MRAVRRSGPSAVLLLLLTLYFPGCSKSNKDVARSDAPQSPEAAVVKVVRKNLADKLEIASEFVPLQEIDVHAKVSGYVKKLYIDWGTHVKQGQLLAVLEIPELEDQIAREQAAQQDVRNLEERIARDVRLAWANAETGYQNLAVTAQLLEQANLALALAQGRYNLGLSSVVELSQAQLNQADAAIQDVNAHYDYQIDHAALEYQVGRLR